MKNIVFGIGIFFFSIFALDCLLSFFLQKDVYVLMQKKIEIIPGEKSMKQVDWAEKVRSVSGTPMWNVEYRGPFFYTFPKKTRSCRILGVGDSIMYGSGVFSNETYMYLISKVLKNTEVINLATPGYDAMQEIQSLENTDMLDDADMLIWHFWEDDAQTYTLVNGVLYDSRIVLNDFGYPQFLTHIPVTLNNFLIRYSYLYNETLKIQMKTATKREILERDLVILKMEEFLQKFRNRFPQKSIVVLFSPALENDSYTFSYSKPGNMHPELYEKIKEVFEKYDNTYVIYLEEFFTGIPVETVRHDTCCHFSEDGHQIIAEKLVEFIKSKKLFNEDCF